MKSGRWVWVGLAAASVVGALAALGASSSPDGLERVAADKGFLAKAVRAPLLASPLPEYLFPGISDPRLAAGLAGFAGTLVLFALGYCIGWVLRQGRRRGA